jgi:hypothetical protein
MAKDGTEELGANEIDGISNAIEKKEDTLEAAREIKQKIMQLQEGHENDAQGGFLLNQEGKLGSN